MKKYKILLAMVVMTTITLSGCASNFKEAIGYVTPESLKKNSFLVYENNGISDELAMLDIFLDEFNVEYSAYTSGKVEFNQANVWNDNIKKMTISNEIEKLKNILVLNTQAKKNNITLSESDKKYIENSAKTQLGQTYKNLIVDYLKGKGVNLTSELMIDYLTMIKLAEVTRVKLIENVNTNIEYGDLVSYIDLTVPVNAGATEQASKTAEAVKEKIEKGENIDSIVSEFTLNKIEGIESANYPSKIFSDEVKKEVIALEKNNVKILEFKAGDKVVGFHVVKILDKNSEEIKKKAQVELGKQAKADIITKQLAEWNKKVTVNQEKFDKIGFKLDTKFWESYKDIILRSN